MENAVLSVVITTYQRNIEIIMQAVQSVLDQTFKNLELIIVDDNGRGSELQIINEKYFKEISRVHYIANYVNSGAQFSRNQGILASSGMYIAFLDDDDIWVPNKIEEQIGLFDNEKIGLVFCDGYNVIDDDYKNKILYQQLNSFSQDITFSMMLFQDYVGTTSQVLIRRSSFSVAGLFDYDMPARQDYEMWLRISKYFTLKGINEPLFIHRMHEGEQISKNMKKVQQGYEIIYYKYKKFYNQNKKAKVKILLKIALLSKQNKQIYKCFKLLTISFLTNPIYTLTAISKKAATK